MIHWLTTLFSRLLLAVTLWVCSTSLFAQESRMNLTKIAQVSVRTKDLQRATAFYRDTLGLKVVISNTLISILDCGGITLLLGPSESSSIIYFEVDDIKKTVETLAGRGVKIEEKPNIVGQLGNVDVWIAIFKDSEDNSMGLMSKTPR
jgi:predicted enzyme related to lactoylglutathione lyase